ncbi:FecR family protein [Nitrobacter sp.]|uniref:FecR family protein n=1 Tax=Nitrobacter sp. TaxID=29420 RepID=UPI003F64B7FF
MNRGEKQPAIEEAAEWFVRRDAGPLSPGETQEFARWLSDPKNRTAYAEIGGTWENVGRLPRPVEVEKSRGIGWTALTRHATALAAALLVVVGLGFAFDLPMRLRADGYTGVGETRTLMLPDGSKVVLNTESAVALAYDAGVRRVRLLRGEAVFTVTKDPSRPFLVDAAGGEARALGTEFDVRNDGDGATVTVLESRVGVSYPVGAPALITLAPDEAVDYSATGLGAVRSVDASVETAWLRGKLIFVDRPLGQVVAELNRYHRGTIRITDAAMRDQRVSGVFDTADPLRVIDFLERSLGLHSTRLTDYLILLHR